MAVVFEKGTVIIGCLQMAAFYLFSRFCKSVVLFWEVANYASPIITICSDFFPYRKMTITGYPYVSFFSMSLKIFLLEQKTSLQRILQNSIAVFVKSITLIYHRFHSHMIIFMKYLISFYLTNKTLNTDHQRHLLLPRKRVTGQGHPANFVSKVELELPVSQFETLITTSSWFSSDLAYWNQGDDILFWKWPVTDSQCN